MHTRMLQRMPLQKTASQGAASLPAVKARAPAETPVSATAARPAMIREPTKFPRKTTDQFLQSSASLALPAAYEQATNAKFPVTNSPPPPRTIKRPMGKPISPAIMRCTPGFAALIAGTDPPHDTIRNAPRPMCAPDRSDNGISFFVGVEALVVPVATAASYTPGGPGRGGGGVVSGAGEAPPPVGVVVVADIRVVVANFDGRRNGCTYASLDTAHSIAASITKCLRGDDDHHPGATIAVYVVGEGCR
mmetsp:Transcript_26175/g.84723  ORF Transcript_26175/g.84723 Transcript_26175/m.84723 type:complete len:248 (-) Transcript_26175:127-870(-)